jgi:hypothetical protein
VDVQIGQITSAVRTVDSESLLSPDVLDRIVRVVLIRVREEQVRERRGAAERELRPNRTGTPYLEGQGGDW